MSNANKITPSEPTLDSDITKTENATAADFLQTAIKDAVSWQRENYKTGFLSPKLHAKTDPFQFFMSLTAKAEMLKQTALQLATANNFDAALINSTQNIIDESLKDLAREFWQ